MSSFLPRLLASNITIHSIYKSNCLSHLPRSDCLPWGAFPSNPLSCHVFTTIKVCMYMHDFWSSLNSSTSRRDQLGGLILVMAPQSHLLSFLRHLHITHRQEIKLVIRIFPQFIKALVLLLVFFLLYAVLGLSLFSIDSDNEADALEGR